MKNPVYETMTYWKAPNGYRVRVWREEPRLTRGPDREVLDVIRQQTFCGDMVPVPEFIKAIAELPRVSAIEILDPNRQGALYYPDWK